MVGVSRQGVKVWRGDRGKLSKAIEVKWRSWVLWFLDAGIGASNIGRWNVQRLTLDAGSCSVQHSREVFEVFLWDFLLGWFEVVLGLGLGGV